MHHAAAHEDDGGIGRFAQIGQQHLGQDERRGQIDVQHAAPGGHVVLLQRACGRRAARPHARGRRACRTPCRWYRPSGRNRRPSRREIEHARSRAAGAPSASISSYRRSSLRGVASGEDDARAGAAHASESARPSPPLAPVMSTARPASRSAPGANCSGSGHQDAPTSSLAAARAARAARRHTGRQRRVPAPSGPAAAQLRCARAPRAPAHAAAARARSPRAAPRSAGLNRPQRASAQLRPDRICQ